jgi:aminoglycoside 6'-N-acetyltransferase I
MEPDASRAVGGANAARVGHKARNGVAQARRAGISVAVGDLIHPKSPSGAASGTTRRPSTIGGDAAPLGLGVRGRCAWAAKMPAVRAFCGGPLRRGRAIAHGHTDRTIGSRLRRVRVLVYHQIRTVPEAALPVEEDMHIRELKSEHRDAWIRLRHRLWPELGLGEHAKEVERLLGGWGPQPYAVFVAESQDGRIVGFVEMAARPYAEGCSTSPVAFLEGWYVEPGHRRCGVGRRLVEAGEAWAESLGLTELGSDADLDNEESAVAHAAIGFAEVARVRCFRKTLRKQ